MPTDYEQLTNRELRELATKRELDVPRNANKATLVALLTEHEPAADVVESDEPEPEQEPEPVTEPAVAPQPAAEPVAAADEADDTPEPQPAVSEPAEPAVVDTRPAPAAGIGAVPDGTLTALSPELMARIPEQQYAELAAYVRDHQAGVRMSMANGAPVATVPYVGGPMGDVYKDALLESLTPMEREHVVFV